MNIVINIDDHKYKEIKEDAEVYRNKGMVVPYLYKVIESGISIPKGYGDLIDRRKLINDGINKGFCDWYDEIKNADAIIPAEGYRK